MDEQPALDEQALQKLLGKMVTEIGPRRPETPFNLILEARP